MAWTELHGPLIARAFSDVLGEPESGAIAFARCLAPDVVKRLAEDRTFVTGAWQVRRVAAAEQDVARTVTADYAVELRESKSDALLLLVDTEQAGAGMDGIYSAAREVDEATLFREARRLAAREITRRRTAAIRRYAEAALSVAARRYGGREAVSPWTAFDYMCRVAAGKRSPGAFLHFLGLWPISDSEESTYEPALSAARRFVDRLLGPATSNLAPAARIESLRLDSRSLERQSQLERFLHSVDAKPLLTALHELEIKENLWVGALRIEQAARSIRGIELTPWRNTRGTLHKWSGLALPEATEEPPALILSQEGTRTGSTLEVRWTVDPADLEHNAVDYRVAVLTSNLDEELAGQDVAHFARKSGEKCRFSGDDFSTLDDDSLLSAKVVVAVIGNDKIERQESEEFIIRFGEPPNQETDGVGVKVRTFSEGLIELQSRDAARETALAPQLTAGTTGYVTLRSPVEAGRRKSFRVFRPSLIEEIEHDWIDRQGRIGRWVVKVRTSGERAGSAEFVQLDGAGAEWERAETASRRIAARFAETHGGVAQIYDDHCPAFDRVKLYLKAWSALLKSGPPNVAIANTVEVQALSGRTLGVIVLPAHPLRMAWLAAYDNLVLHAAFEQGAKSGEIRKELKGLDGAMFPEFLPNPGGGAFVFADTLGFHAVGMVPDDDPEPKAAVAMLTRALGDSGSPDAAPTVGEKSAGVLSKEIVKYLDCHDTARLLRVHALRAGDGMTVARSLGDVHHHYRAASSDEDADGPPGTPVFSLDLYPSAAQRGVTGRFIAGAREKRRSGAGVLADGDRWMLESLSLPGGVNLPRLRWARKEQADPETAAHLAIAFDTFESRVRASATDTRPPSRPYHAFGLFSFYDRQYTSIPAPHWISAAPPPEKGEKHPSSRTHTETLTRLQRAVQESVAAHLGAAGLPALSTEISRERADSLNHLHRLCDWVITLDRNAGIEYFDSPRDDPAVYDAYVIDCVPERDDLGCLQLITSTANLDEVRSLLDHALDQMGLSRSRRNAEFLMDHLKALSGRLAIRLTGHRPATSELVALAVSYANCRLSPSQDDCWVPLSEGFVIPVDDVRDLLPPLSATGGGHDEARWSRPDLVYVTILPRGGLAFRFIEIKYRRHLRAARSPEVLDDVRRQTQDLRKRWLQWYSHKVPSAFRALRRAKLARVLRFYADKAHRHVLPADRHKAMISEIDRMVERGAAYGLTSVEGGDRGWIFCPEYAGDRPLKISPDEWGTHIYLVGARQLPDSDFRADPAHPVPTEPQAAAPEQTPPSEAHDDSSVAPNDAPMTAGHPVSDAAIADTGNSTRSIYLGTDLRTNTSVQWALTVRGNPHLLVAGLPGMGKTTCLLNLCKQMAAAQVRPIVFSYHQDIDEKLVQEVDSVRFIDFDDGLGFHPLRVMDRAVRRAHLDVAADMRDLFTAIYPELGDIQGERVRSAVKESFSKQVLARIVRL